MTTAIKTMRESTLVAEGSLLPGMFVRIKQSTPDSSDEDGAAPLPGIGQIVGGGCDSQLLVRWHYKTEQGAIVHQDAETPCRLVSRWIHLPETKCFQVASHKRCTILAVARPVAPVGYLSYYVQSDTGVQCLPEKDLRVTKEDIVSPLVDLLAGYVFSSPERKLRRDRLVEKMYWYTPRHVWPCRVGDGAGQTARSPG